MTISEDLSPDTDGEEMSAVGGFMPVADAARAFGLSPRLLVRWAAQRRLHVVVDGRWLIRRADLEALAIGRPED